MRACCGRLTSCAPWTRAGRRHERPDGREIAGDELSRPHFHVQRHGGEVGASSERVGAVDNTVAEARERALSHQPSLHRLLTSPGPSLLLRLTSPGPSLHQVDLVEVIGILRKLKLLRRMATAGESNVIALALAWQRRDRTRKSQAYRAQRGSAPSVCARMMVHARFR